MALPNQLSNNTIADADEVMENLEYLLNLINQANNEFSGITRQAVMNGNFNVWQRGTSATLADVTKKYLADRWSDYVDKNGGTLPTLTRSQQALTPGELPGAFYFSRLTTSGAGSSLGVSSHGLYAQKIEHGVRFLCGLDKYVTVSFWARSSITDKRITPTIRMNYGTGGSPTAQEIIKGEPITLTSDWTQHEVTFLTNTLEGKTFGTNNDDNLELDFWYMWGTTAGDTYVKTGVTAETFVGAGDIDIAQVQLNAGSVALPFQPKAFEEDLRVCQRYFEKSFNYGTAPADAASLSGALSIVASSAFTYHVVGSVNYKVTKRSSVNPTLYNPVASSADKIRNVNANTNHPGALSAVGESGFMVYINNSASTQGHTYSVQWAVDADF